MKVALVSPVEFLYEVQPFSDYHLIQTYKVIYEPKYRDFYAQRSKAGDFVILDNGAVEKNGRSVPLKDIVLAAVLTKPSLVILPDYLFDSDRTLDELENALRSPQLRFMRRVLPNIKLCAVVQGVNEADWLECFYILNDPKNGIDQLGIPKITGQIFGSRKVALERIRKKIKKPCHLLGVWWKASLDDVRQEAQYPFVVGVDTPKPLRLAAYGMGLERWAEMPRGKDFIDRKHVNGIDLELLRSNCAEFVELCK